MTLAPWRALSLAVALAAVAAPALAHHSFSLFDPRKSLTLEGTVKEFQWTNPHTWIQVLVKDAEGKQKEWSIEGESAAALSRQGWSRETVRSGDKIIVVIHPLKDGTNGGSLISATVNGQPVGSHS